MPHLCTGRDIVKRFSCGRVNGAIARMFLPAANGNVDIERIDFDAMADAAHALSRNQRAAGTEKAVQDNIAAGGAVEESIGHKRDRFDSGMKGKQIAFLVLPGESVYAGILPHVGPVAA